ncbi:hypothetical protein EDB81DRAFT_845460 [Dactylonectria macrodidyma]|uniref:Glucose-methanol-choline oxidoreductase N-terminal domain-containing protein n=1 Tax=Dactylonectria macrodidyma TaxID=307937 RepID=A0A9P9ITI7_9HYPO|nr:hypothetical protein EDB81DRAFT_845460 [Dactylonectria macrodidyma]
MANSMDYDFIVVGAGPAGCTAATTIAGCKSQPRVLLIEAGGDNANANTRIDGNKYIQFTNPDQSRHYMSEKIDGLGGRQVELVDGKGLGGSTAINLTVWMPGPRDDMEAMRELMDDQTWGWRATQERLRRLETFTSPASDLSEHISPSAECHGFDGPIRVGYPPRLEDSVMDTLKRWSNSGYQINREPCDGSHLGICIAPITTHRGERSTAADLLPSMQNLDILTEAQVHRVLFDGNTAVGVVLVDGRVFRASKEVILSAGVRETPKILILSGVGPSDQLSQFGIPVVYANENIGQNYRDHSHICIKYVADDTASERVAFFKDPARQQAALREWQLFRTGEYSYIGSALVLGFFKSLAVAESSEFNALSETEKQRLQAPTIPTYEVALNTIPSDFYSDPPASSNVIPVYVFLHNSQATGNTRLRSADPGMPLSTSPMILNHPYDRRVAVEATREVMKVLKSTSACNEWVKCPASDKEKDILEFWSQNCVSSWHATGTCQMGKDEKRDRACVSTCFKVFGVTGLRIADLSIMPFSPSTHPQPTAYQIGMIAAEKIIEEHSLNGTRK